LNFTEEKIDPLSTTPRTALKRARETVRVGPRTLCGLARRESGGARVGPGWCSGRITANFKNFKRADARPRHAKETRSMSQKLNFSSIAATLAALSASGLIACGGSAPPAASPADAKEVPAAAAPVAAAPTDAPADAAKTADAPAPAAGDAPAAATPADPKAVASDAPTTVPAAAPAKTDDKPKAVAKKKAAGAKAGCGAGTCG
jgi:hypothetical protein